MQAEKRENEFPDNAFHNDTSPVVINAADAFDYAPDGAAVRAAPHHVLCGLFDLRLSVVSSQRLHGQQLRPFSVGLQHFDAVTVPAAKSDIFKLAAMYMHGGWYFGIDIRLKTTLDMFPADEPVLFRIDSNPNPVTNKTIKMPARTEFMKDCMDLVWQHYSRNSLSFRGQ